MAMEKKLKDLLRLLRSSGKRVRDKDFKGVDEKIERAYKIIKEDENLLKKVLAIVSFDDRDALAGFVHFLIWLHKNEKREYVEPILKRMIELPPPEEHSIEKYKKYIANLYYLLAGYLSEDKKRMKEAEQYFRKSLELNPDHISAHEEYATFLYSLGRFTEAVPHFKTAIKESKDTVSLRMGYALTLTMLKKFTRAKKQFRLASNNAKQRNFPREFIDEFQWIEKAFVETDRAIYLLQSGASPSVCRIKSLCKRVKKFFDSYEKRGEKIGPLQLDLKDAFLGMIHTVEGVLELRRRNPAPEKALFYFESAERIFGDDLHVKQNIAVAYWLCGFLDLALEETEEVIDLCRKFKVNNKSALRLKGILEAIRDGRFKPPFPNVGWRLTALGIVVLFWLMFLLLPKIGFSFSLLDTLLNHIWILIVTSIIGVAIWIFYPLLRFIRGVKNIPWVGEVNISPFLAEAPSSFIRSFIMDFEDRDKQRRKQRRLELGIPPNIFP